MGSTLTHGSLFSGIGGFDLGARWAGIPTIWQVESDPFCQKLLYKNFPGVPKFGDIKNVKSEKLQTVDIISAGMPCQPFSIAGKRRGKKDDRFFWPETYSIIRQLHPHWIIIENVTGIVNMELDTILFDLEKATYESLSFIIPACGLNAPHRRYRLFVIAHSPCNRWKKRMPIAESLAKKVEKWQEEVKSERLAENHWNIWATEPGMDRISNGVSHRVDKLRGLGNAVVPQIAFIIFLAIKESE